MKAAQINQYGQPEQVLNINSSVEKPTIQPDQVLIEVYAAGMNPFDYKIASGIYKDMMPVNFPATLGGDLAGVVAEVGTDVTDFAVGDEIYGMANAVGGSGSYAEFSPVKATSLAVKPTSVDAVMAAALPLASVSAYQGLVEHIELKSGQKILIHGGAGGIGSIAIQIAHQLGAYVATTASSKDVDYLKSIGANEVIDYGSQDFVTTIKDYDAVFDTVGGEANQKSFTVLKPGGVLVSMVQPADEAVVSAANIRYVMESTQVTTEKLAAIAKLIDSGAIQVNVDKVFPFEQAGEALAYLQNGHPRGKVVLKIK